MPSWLAEASRCPSGLYASRLIPFECPRRVRTSRPVLASQSLIVSSELAEAKRPPSGLNATDATTAECPRRVRIERPRGGVPELHGVIGAAAGGDAAAVGAVRHANDLVRHARSTGSTGPSRRPKP